MFGSIAFSFQQNYFPNSLSVKLVQNNNKRVALLSQCVERYISYGYLCFFLLDTWNIFVLIQLYKYYWLFEFDCGTVHLQNAYIHFTHWNKMVWKCKPMNCFWQGERDIGGGKERGNPLWRTEGKHAANIWQANIFVGEKNHEASTVHLSRIVFLP